MHIRTQYEQNLSAAQCTCTVTPRDLPLLALGASSGGAARLWFRIGNMVDKAEGDAESILVRRVGVDSEFAHVF